MNNYFATVARGLEEIAAQELTTLGGENVTPTFTGVQFQGDQKLLYKVNLWSRLIFRVLVPIKTFPCHNAKQLYGEVQEINWENYLSPESTFMVHCTGKNQQLNHTHFSALQVKNAIADQQTQFFGKRSNVNLENPDLIINLHIEKTQGILSLDSTGESLHRRGYRPAMGIAPLKETLAAALLTMTDWETNLPLLDPMCGSGTFPIEAGLKALNIAPGRLRNQFAFEQWFDFNRELWEQLKQEAKQQKLSQLSVGIYGYDRDFDVLKQAQTNAKNCNLQQQIHWSQIELSAVEPPLDRGIIICNPPYGKRIGDTKALGSLYKQLGDIFKQRFKGWVAYVLSGNKALTKQIGLRTSQRIPVYNGSLPCTLLRYELF
ncbi:THUMP domain-containing class I SAM-dependent RNA methyltransferase [Dactylococcopsis salina]|uniref:N6-adenine-specific DNA methylase n=1 Tax=Dactylococcopsis salina (strain PCC 8305) TaxID=13035 RepID=K9YZL5_DACS8|nr:THUMP domain-containing protein [Dactylococcopsis salina]AFZ51740.1 putative N6-adenine-specific DNA methylase [Dactylococcopsis salina PCC 8305]